MILKQGRHFNKIGKKKQKKNGIKLRPRPIQRRKGNIIKPSKNNNKKKKRTKVKHKKALKNYLL